MQELYHQFHLDMMPLTDMNPEKWSRSRFYDVYDIINPDLTALLDKINCVVQAAAVFYSKPGFYSKAAHIDSDIIDNELSTSKVKLNYVFGSIDTQTSWYNLNENTQLVHQITEINQPFYWAPIFGCTEIKRVSLNGWHLFESGVLHSVENKTDYDRWCVSCVIYDKISKQWLDYRTFKTRLLEIC